MKTLPLNLSLIIILFLFACASKKKTEEELRTENIKKAEEVSNEILNTFIELDNKLVDQNLTISEGNNLRLSQYDSTFNSLEVDELLKAKFYQSIAQSAHKISLTNCNKIMFLANEVLKAPLDTENDWIEVNTTGHYSIVDLNKHEYPAKDDYETPMEFFIDQKKGEILYSLIENHRDSLVSIILSADSLKIQIPKIQKETPNDTKYIEKLDKYISTCPEDSKRKIIEIYKILSLPKFVFNHDEKVTWLAGQFDHSPMVACTAILTSLKEQILQAETVALDLVTSKITAPIFKFETIETDASAK